MKFYFLILLFLLPNFFFSQENEIQSNDSIKKHSVRKASILSAVIPGAGQIYNHRAMPKGKKNAFWKIPIIYGGLAATGYSVLSNNQLQKELKSEYNSRVNTGLISKKYEIYDDQGIVSLYYQHLNRRDLFIIGFGAVYLFQILDAAVEAHFVSFDISEDLTLHFKPQVFSKSQSGISLSFNFK